MNRLFKRKNEFSKTIVIIDITIFLLYIIMNIVMMWNKGFTMPVDINTGVFAFLTGELGLLSFIKRSKINNNVKSEIGQQLIQQIPNIQEYQQNINNDKRAAG